jgi:hypothetical protein
VLLAEKDPSAFGDGDADENAPPSSSSTSSSLLLQKRFVASMHVVARSR